MGEKISFIDLFGTELELEDEYAREQLAGESAARAEDVAVLSARMDTFTALPDGSTAGDAELTDIRVGADGVTYPNAGDAVRAQATKLKDDFNELINGIHQITDIIQGSYSSTGSIVANTARIRTKDFIPATTGDAINFTKGENASNVLVGYFTSDKQFIADGSWHSETGTIAIDHQNVGYIIAVFKNDTSTSITPAQFDASVSITRKHHFSAIASDMDLYAGNEVARIPPRNGIHIYMDGDNCEIEETTSSNTSVFVKVSNMHIRSGFDGTLTYPLDGYGRDIYIQQVGTNPTYESSLGTPLVTSPNGLENCIEIPEYSSLVFNMKTNLIEIVARLAIKKYHVVLITNLAGRVTHLHPYFQKIYTNQKTKEQRDNTNNILTRNKDIEHIVNSASRYGHHANGIANFEKQFSMLLTTDVHGDTERFNSAIQYLNSMPSVDCGICLGDIVPANYSQNKEWYTSAVNSSNKPFYTVIGNHDGGNSTDGSISATVQETFEAFIEPTLSKIGLPNLTNPYYAIHNSTYGVSLFVLDCYDVPDDKNGEDFVVSRGRPAFSQNQIDWFVEELNNVPEGNCVIVAMHAVFDPHSNMVDGWHTPGWDINASEIPHYQYPNMIPDIIDAWVNGSTLNKTYTPPNNTIGLPAITVSADYTERGTGIFACYLQGHAHFDQTTKITKYNYQNIVCVAATANDLWQNYWSDLPREIGTKAEDCITVLVVDKLSQEVKLVRVGSNVTYNLTTRDLLTLPYDVE